MLRAGNRSPMTLDGTRTFVLGSRRPLVIDPGPDDETHLEALVQMLGGVPPAAILLTHAHADHAGNAAALAARTGAPIRIGRGALRLPFPRERVDRWLQDGEVLESDGGPLEVHATPGHCPEHVAFLYRPDEASRALFAGDLFLGVGDTTLVSRPAGDVADYLRSLEVVTRLEPTVIYPAHGPALRQPERAISRYRAHRLERIEQVRRARRERPRATAADLLEAVYGSELDPRFRRAALGSIEAVLVYLGEEAEWA